MAAKDDFKNGACLVGGAISEFTHTLVEKNRIRAKTNRLKQIIKGDSQLRDDAYIALGKYFYENLREGASEENEELCKVVDKTNLRIEKASMRYIELLNEQNDLKVQSENAEKLKKALAKKAEQAKEAASDKAKDLTQKAKETSQEITQKVKDKAVDLKNKAANKAEDVKLDIEDAADEVVDSVEEVFDTESALDIESADIERLIKEEEEKIKSAEVSAVSETEEKKADEESPEDFTF